MAWTSPVRRRRPIPRPASGRRSPIETSSSGTAGRGRGQAPALTGHVVRTLFAEGTGVVTLFADDANRTSTGIYRRLGFRPAFSWAVLHLAW